MNIPPYDWIYNDAGTVTATLTTVNNLLGLPTKLPVTISGTVRLNNLTATTQATAVASGAVSIFGGEVCTKKRHQGWR